MKRCRKIQRVIGGGGRRQACWFVAWETSRDAVWNAACQQNQSVTTHEHTDFYSLWVSGWPRPMICTNGVWRLSAACLQFRLHQSDLMKLSMVLLAWLCVFAGNAASPANTQQIKNSACLLSLQPLHCSMIHLDNSREETAGTTLNARLCCCSMFTSLHTW